jgi:hypothetical protein
MCDFVPLPKITWTIVRWLYNMSNFQLLFNFYGTFNFKIYIFEKYCSNKKNQNYKYIYSYLDSMCVKFELN